MAPGIAVATAARTGLPALPGWLLAAPEQAWLLCLGWEVLQELARGKRSL